MKRDMDLMRDLLLQIEEVDQGFGNEVEIEQRSHEPQVVAQHLRLLLEAKLIDGDTVLDEEYPSDHVMPTRLTWAGLDFLGSVRDPEIWKKTKEGALSAKGFTLDLLQDVARRFIKKQIEDRTGIAL